MADDNVSEPECWADAVDAEFPLQPEQHEKQSLPAADVSQLRERFENLNVHRKGHPQDDQLLKKYVPPKGKTQKQRKPQVVVTRQGRELSKRQQKFHQQFQQHLNGTAPASGAVRSFFGDSQATTGATELRFSIIDWIERPFAPSQAAAPVFNYYLDVGRPFFSDASTIVGTQSTRSKVRKVKLWFLSPQRATDDVTLLQILCAVPVKDEGTGTSTDAYSLIGQSNTIIHPDVRQPWVMVGNWNWETIFENSQFQPVELPAPTSASPFPRDCLALFSFLVIDATTGAQFSGQATGSSHLKVEIELQAPIPMVPTPLRVVAETADFNTPPDAQLTSTDQSPVQYSLHSIHRQM